MTIDFDSLSLETRSGLPDTLRVLVQKFPREDWKHNEHFGGLVQFWLERHLMFRKVTNTLVTDAQNIVEKRFEPQTYRERLARFGNWFVGELHTHHMIEDHQYFPALQKLEPQIANGFVLLDKDHHALDSHLLHFTDGANTILAAQEDHELRKVAGPFLEELRKLEMFLDRHLVDEEELVVPVILRHGFSG